VSLRDPDAFYQALVRLHDGLDSEESQRLNARLILLLAAHIDDERVLQEVLRLTSDTRR
jgi:hypothetical protein